MRSNSEVLTSLYVLRSRYHDDTTSNLCSLCLPVRYLRSSPCAASQARRVSCLVRSLIVHGSNRHSGVSAGVTSLSWSVAGNFTTTMSEPRTNLQKFQTAQRPKRKRSFPTASSEATTSFLSPNQFAVLSDSESDIEENGAPSQSNIHQTRIPPIVIYSYLNNHSATVKPVNEKLTTPVDVKSKANRLLLYTKFSHVYILLTEIRAAKLAYHTYPLLEATQPRLELKGIPPNVPEEDVREELATHDIQTVRITQITKMDKSTQTVITKYPIFVITFQPGTNMHKVLQLHKVSLYRVGEKSPYTDQYATII